MKNISNIDYKIKDKRNDKINNAYMNILPFFNGLSIDEIEGVLIQIRLLLYSVPVDLAVKVK